MDVNQSIFKSSPFILGLWERWQVMDPGSWPQKNPCLVSFETAGNSKSVDFIGLVGTPAWVGSFYTQNRAGPGLVETPFYIHMATSKNSVQPRRFFGPLRCWLNV